MQSSILTMTTEKVAVSAADSVNPDRIQPNTTRNKADPPIGAVYTPHSSLHQIPQRLHAHNILNLYHNTLPSPSQPLAVRSGPGQRRRRRRRRLLPLALAHAQGDPAGPLPLRKLGRKEHLLSSGIPLQNFKHLQKLSLISLLLETPEPKSSTPRNTAAVRDSPFRNTELDIATEPVPKPPLQPDFPQERTGINQSHNITSTIAQMPPQQPRETTRNTQLRNRLNKIRLD